VKGRLLLGVVIRVDVTILKLRAMKNEVKDRLLRVIQEDTTILELRAIENEMLEVEGQGEG
jgi:hypothetical protein